MGVKKINSFWLIQNAAMSGTSSVFSIPSDMQNFDNEGLEITWSGTPTGVISIAGSVSQALPLNAGVNFYALTFNPILAQPAGSAGGYLIDLNQFPFPYMQFQYVNTSGSGTLNVYLCKKDLN
jgi:hypothetical protein